MNFYQPEFELRVTPTSFIASMANLKVISEIDVLRDTSTIATYFQVNGFSKNRLICDCARQRTKAMGTVS